MTRDPLDETRPTFSDLLKVRTKTIHREAERAGFIADLLRGRATPAGYALFLRNLVPVYDALETALKCAGPGPIVAAFADPRLRRLPPLEADLAALAGPHWRDLAVVAPANTYAAAIEAAAADPLRLVAHAYARYLGDLSGGQILKPLLARTLGLGSEMLTFYDFPALADLDAAKADLREALDAVAADDPRAEAAAAEAVAAFRHNIAVAEAVQAALG